MSKEEKPKTLIERFGFKDKDLSTPEHDRILLWLLDYKNSLSMLNSLGIISRANILQLNRPYHQVDCDWSWKKTSCSGICQKTKYHLHDEENLLRINETMKKHSEATSENYKYLIEQAKALASQNFKDLISIEVEHAIIGYRKFNIGFVDVMITVKNLFAVRKIETIDYQPVCSFFYIPFKILNEQEEPETIYVEIKPKVYSIGELMRQINMYRSHTRGGIWIVATKTPNLRDVLASQNVYVYELKEG